MVTIRKADEAEYTTLTPVFIEAFHDKVMAVIGDRERAATVIPDIIRGFDGAVFVAENDGDAGGVVGAILVSTTHFRISGSIAWSCIRNLGIGRSVSAMLLVSNYLRSCPGKNENEGTLEVVGVLPEHRNEGIGSELVDAGQRFLEGSGMQYYGLGVKKGNPAYNWYRSLHFSMISEYRNKLGDWLYLRKRI